MNEHQADFLLDIDGVCANWLARALPVVRLITGTQYTPEDFPTWDIFDVICAGMTEADARAAKSACNEHFHAHGFCSEVLPYAGAIEGVERLRSLATVHPVTAPTHSRHWYFERGEWVRRYLGIDPHDVHHTRHKEQVHGDFLLDDSPRHVLAWAKKHPEGLGLLWDQPYNQPKANPLLLDAPSNVVRVRSWDAVAGIVRGYHH